MTAARLLLVVGVSVGMAVRADDKTRLRDLLGLQPATAEHGLVFDLFATQFGGAVRGGQDSGGVLGGKLDALLTADGERFGLWRGLHLDLHAETRYGTDAAGRDGLLMPAVLPMTFPVESRSVPAITNLTLTQSVGESVQVYTGKLNTLGTFALRFEEDRRTSLPGYAGFAAGPLVFNPIDARTVPYSGLAAGVAVVRDGVPVLAITVLDPAERAGRAFDRPFENGVTVVPELNLRGRLLGRPNRVNLGGVVSTARTTLFDPASYLEAERFDELAGAGVPPARDGSWAVFYHGYQAIWTRPEDDARGWGVFAGVGLSDGDPNPIRSTAAGGVAGRGVLGGRPLDLFGVGYYHLGLSRAFIAATRPFRPQRDESGVEVFYNAALTPWCRLTGNLLVARPSTALTDRVLYTGLRLQLIF